MLNMATELTEEGFWPGRSDLQEFYPSLFLTNSFGARNMKKLKAKGITHVLICGSYLQPSFPDKFAYKQMKLDDNATDAQKKALLDQLDDVIDFVFRALEDAKAKVLLHCGQGRSRSGAVAAALVMVCVFNLVYTCLNQVKSYGCRWLCSEIVKLCFICYEVFCKLYTDADRLM